ncbi:MAG: DUF58 domain-containing protein [Proteobacteria bacterium]|nr:MAG: DUF58 domain-containing protein [Pseudomonadota bacterium]
MNSIRVSVKRGRKMFSLKSKFRKFLPLEKSGKPYILPTFYGIGFLFLIVDIFALGYYRDNAPYHTVGLTLIVFGLVAMIHTNANIQSLEVTLLDCEPMAAGDSSEIRLTVRCTGPTPAHNLWIELPQSAPYSAERVTLLEVTSETDGSLSVHCDKRGVYSIDKIKVLSRGVYGLFQAWSWHTVKTKLIVYPQPRGNNPLPTGTETQAKKLEGEALTKTVSGDDFQGHKPYRVGDSLQHVDWKAYARGQDMLIKDYSGEGSEALDLHWDDTRGSTEERLEQLSAWIVLMNRAQRPYSLHLPNLSLSRGSGLRHDEEAYYALAAFEEV